VLQPAPSVELAGTASDDGLGLDRVRVRIQRLGNAGYWNGSEWQGDPYWLTPDVVEGNWLVPAVDLSVVDDYRVLLNLTDYAGNFVSASEIGATDFAIRLNDASDPVGAVIVPDSVNSISPNTDVDIFGTAIDDLSGVEQVLVRLQRKGHADYWNGNGWQGDPKWISVSVDENGGWMLGAVDLSLVGGYRVLLRVTDGAGNQSTASENGAHDFSVEATLPDTTDPMGVVLTPDAPVPASSSIDISGTATDDISGIDRILVRIQRSNDSAYWNGVAWQVPGKWISLRPDRADNWRLSAVDLSEIGQYRILLNVRDNSGNVSTAAENGVFLLQTN